MSNIVDLFEEHMKHMADLEWAGKTFMLSHELLAHTRDLEATLEWALDTISDVHGEEFAFCPTCDKLKEARKVLE